MFGRSLLVLAALAQALVSSVSANVVVYAPQTAVQQSTQQVASWDYSTEPTLQYVLVFLRNTGGCGFSVSPVLITPSFIAANTGAYPLPTSPTGQYTFTVPTAVPAGGCYYLQVVNALDISKSWNSNLAGFTILSSTAPSASPSSVVASPSPSASPNGDVIVYAQTAPAMKGTQQVLSWDYSAYPSLSQVTITLENTGGCGFTQAPVSLATGIAANTGAFPAGTPTGSLTWTIPTTVPTGGCYFIRVKNSLGTSSWLSTNKGRGFMTFIASTPSAAPTPSASKSPAVVITSASPSPSPGVVYVYAQTVAVTLGTQQVLSWDFSLVPSLSLVTITLENTGGCGFTQAPVSLATSIAANTGAFPAGTPTGSLTWTVPAVTAGGCYFIRVKNSLGASSWLSTNKGRGFMTFIASTPSAAPTPSASKSPSVVIPSVTPSPSAGVVYVYAQTVAVNLGTQQVVSWDFSLIPSLSQVTVTLENSGGCGFTQAPVSLATGIAANTGASPAGTPTGSIVWTVPTSIQAGSCYFIRVKNALGTSSWLSTNKGRGFMTFLALPASPSPSPSTLPASPVNFVAISYVISGAPYNLIWFYASAPFTAVDVLLRKPDNSEILLLTSVPSAGGSVYNVAYPIVPKGTVATVTNGFSFVLRANNAAQTKYVTAPFTLYP